MLTNKKNLLKKMNEEKMSYSLKDITLESFIDDEEVVLAVIKRSGPKEMQFASERLKSDECFMEKAIECNPDVLEFAGEKIKDNESFMKKVVLIDEYLMCFASERLKNSKDFLVKIISKKPYALEYFNEEFREDPEIVLTALNRNKEFWTLIGDNLKERLEPLYEEPPKLIQYLKFLVDEKKSNEQAIHMENVLPKLESKARRACL